MRGQTTRAAHYEVGSFEAKTRFAELLRKTEEGAIISITRNGHSIAVLQGIASVQQSAALTAIDRIRKRSIKLADQAAQNGFAPLSPLDIKEMVENGRKY